MTNKEKIVSVLHAVKGKKDNIETIVDTLEQFFENLHLELEDWKISMEEFQEGTRIFVRFQIIVKR
jgi:hypothetical protein